MKLLTLLLWVCLASLVQAEEVTFPVGPDTLYGTFQMPANPSGKVPAILLLSGSGPTDRNGNSRLLQAPINSHKHLAEVLAANGVATLRYDKLFSGKTGPATHAGNYTQIGIDSYVEEARTAYAYLASRPEVDPNRLMILGHSEGGLIALIVAKEAPPAGLKGLILAMPMSEPYLKTVRDQVGRQYAEAVKQGALTQKVADEDLALVDKVIAELVATGAAPSRPKLRAELQQLFAPANDRFLATASRYDAAELARAVALPILVFSGGKDVQITAPMIAHLMQGLSGNSRARLVELKNSNHVMRDVEGAPRPGVLDYTDASKPFSPEADRTLAEWVKANL